MQIQLGPIRSELEHNLTGDEIDPWFEEINSDLGGVTPRQFLVSGGDFSAAVSAARLARSRFFDV